MKLSKTKILFIVSNFFFIETHQEDLYYNDFPLGILQIISYLKKKANVKSYICDLRVEGLEFPELGGNEPNYEKFEKSLLRVLKKCKIAKIRNVAISCYTSYHYMQTELIAKILRKQFPNINIIVGGYHPTAVPDDFTYQGAPYDYIIKGESEDTLLQLIQQNKLKNKGTKPKKIILEGKTFQNIDLLPLPDYELYLKKYSGKIIPKFELYISRGCPYQCAFCGSNYDFRSFTFNNFIRKFDQFCRIVNKYSKASKPKISFADQSFDKVSIYQEVLKYIYENQLYRKYEFSCQCRVENLTLEQVRLLRNCNFIIGFGFESASPRLLRLMDKTHDPRDYIDKMIQKLQLYKNESGIYCRLNILCGFPGETLEDFMITVIFIKWFALHKNIQISPTLFSNYPNIKVYKNLEDYRYNGSEFNENWWHTEENYFKLSVPMMISENYPLVSLLRDYIGQYSEIIKFFIKENLKTLFNNNPIGALSPIIMWEKFYKEWIQELESEKE